MLRKINLENKCGSCDHYRQMGDTAHGECLKRPYGEDVVHNPNFPYAIVPRSRCKCIFYNALTPTNADRIRAMSDEELAVFFDERPLCPEPKEHCPCNCAKCWIEWLKQPAEEE